MKNTIKDLLDDMIQRPVIEMISLKDAYEKMRISDANDVVGELLSWQKGLYNNLVPSYKNMSKNKLLILGEFLPKRFKDFFKYSPILKELFILEKNQVTLNLNLTEEEIAEIRIYIDDHYKIPIHMRGHGTQYI